MLQSEQFQTGSSGQLELYPQHISQFVVFLPKTKKEKVDMKWQEKLAAKVERASTARQESRAKLEQAKKMLEKEIEGGGLNHPRSSW